MTWEPRNKTSDGRDEDDVDEDDEGDDKAAEESSSSINGSEDNLSSGGIGDNSTLLTPLGSSGHHAPPAVNHGINGNGSLPLHHPLQPHHHFPHHHHSQSLLHPHQMQHPMLHHRTPASSSSSPPVSPRSLLDGKPDMDQRPSDEKNPRSVVKELGHHPVSHHGMNNEPGNNSLTQLTPMYRSHYYQPLQYHHFSHHGMNGMNGGGATSNSLTPLHHPHHYHHPWE